MPAYRFNEGSIQLAEEFVDQTVNSFTMLVSELERQVINITLSRDIESSAADAVAYANEQLVAMAKALPKYEILDRKDIQLLGEPTVVIEYSWLSNGHEIRQRQTYLHLGTHVLVFTMSFAASQVELADVHWLGLLDSLRLA